MLFTISGGRKGLLPPFAICLPEGIKDFTSQWKRNEVREGRKWLCFVPDGIIIKGEGIKIHALFGKVSNTKCFFEM